MRIPSALLGSTAPLAVAALFTVGLNVAVAQDQPAQTPSVQGESAVGESAVGQPAQSAPGTSAPGEMSPGEVTPGQTAPGQTAPGQTAQGEPATGQAAEPAEMQQQPAANPPAAADMPPPNDQMQAVLDKLMELGAQPLGTQSVEETRAQPTPADAVMALMQEQGIEPDPALAAVQTQDITIPGPEGEIQARIYTPEGEGPFPVIVYYHGGGWVIATIDTYDASARALAAGAEAIVVSSHYRQAPEHTFPAAHEDAYAAYEWAVENSGSFNGDADRMAVAGESAGGNLAANVAIMAHERQAIQPLHQLLVYPIAGHDFDTPSYIENAEAAPLSRAGMMWFFDHYLESPEQGDDPRISLVQRDDLEGLPPATVITAEIDPLRSEGQEYADALEAAGIEVETQNFDGVTHEFFGMGAVVDEAREAVDLATTNLRQAFASAGTDQPTGSVQPQQ